MKKTLVTFCVGLLPLYAGMDLSEAYEKSLENDHSFLALEYETKAAYERVNQAKAQFLPKIQFDGYYNGEYYKRRDIQTNESFTNYGVSLTQPIYKPSLKWEEKQSVLRAKGAKISLELERQNLAKKVAHAYLSVLYSKGALIYAKSHLETNVVRLKQIETSLKMGLSNKMDMLEARVRVDQSLADVSETKKRIEVSLLNLWRLTGEKSETIDRDLAKMNISFFENVSLKDFQNKLSQNLEVQNSLTEENIAIKEKKKRDSEFKPKIDLRLSLSNTDYADSAFSDEKAKREFRLNFSFPIYQGGYRESRVKESLLLLKATKMKIKNVEKDVTVRFEKHMTDFDRGLDLYKIKEKAEEHAEVYIDAMQKSYDEGLKDLVDLLDAKARYFEIKRDKLDATFQIVTSYLELLHLTGEISVDSIGNLDKVLGE